MTLMAEDRPRYYRTKRTNKRAFWEPGQFGVRHGFAHSVPLGVDGPDAKKKAIEWNAKLDSVRKAKQAGEESPRRYPAFSLGSFYEAFRETEAWAQMAPRTREDYDRVWPHIEKRFGHTRVDQISADDSERFHVDIHPAHKPNKKRDPEGKLKLPWNTANRVLKIWRSLLAALVTYKQITPPAPVGRVTNPTPPGRDAIWLHDEVMRLVEVANSDELKLYGMAAAIRVAWDAMFSPIDVFKLPVGGFRNATHDIRTKRQKSQRNVYTSVSNDTVIALGKYLDRLEKAGLSTAPDAPLIRDKVLKPYANKKRFEADFRIVREKAFPGDKRQMLDLRRSAITEGRMGGASLEDLGTTAANNLSTDALLQSTYAHGANAKVWDARAAGRSKMARSGTPRTSNSVTPDTPQDEA